MHRSNYFALLETTYKNSFSYVRSDPFQTLPGTYQSQVKQGYNILLMIYYTECKIVKNVFKLLNLIC